MTGEYSSSPMARILQHAQTHLDLTVGDVVRLLDISREAAYCELEELVRDGFLKHVPGAYAWRAQRTVAA